MEERISSCDELLAKARLALRDKKLRAIVEETRSPNAANDVAESRRFKREKVLSCHALARIKKYYPEKYEELKNKRGGPSPKTSLAAVTPKKIDWPDRIGENRWFKWFEKYVAPVLLVFGCVLCGLTVLFLIFCGISFIESNSHQEPQIVEITATPQVRVEQIVLPSPVVDPTSSTPILLTPPNGSKNELLMSVAFTWSKVIGADKYEFVLSPYPDFGENKDLIRIITDTTAYEITWREGLCYSYSYFWRVRALSGDKTGEWSNINTFMTELVPLPSGPPPPAPPQS